jgi:hypothetical protein
MRPLLLASLFLSFTALAQEKTPGADETSIYRNESDNAILLKSIKLAEPVTSGDRNQHAEHNLAGESLEVTTNTLISDSGRGDFLCPDGTSAACLDSGDKVCPGSARCVDDRATCFDEYPCDPGEGLVCASGYDAIMDDLKRAVTQYDELALENVALRETRLEQKNCVLNASTLGDARRCVRQP